MVWKKITKLIKNCGKVEHLRYSNKVNKTMVWKKNYKWWDVKEIKFNIAINFATWDCEYFQSKKCSGWVDV